jgi:hypothetical protein
MNKINQVLLFSTICSLIFCQISLVDAYSSRSYEDLIQAFMNLEIDHPSLMTHEKVGNTVRNKEITMYKIGNPSGERVVLDGAIHGWENVGSEVLYLYAKWLLTSQDPTAEEILENSYTLIIPALNVDSYNITRKNRNGVDLNRNFATGWERSGSDDPSSEYYHGPSPLSEPENQALIGVFTKYKPKFYVNLHEGGTYYAGCRYGNRTYYSEIVNKVKDFAEERDVNPYYYSGEFGGSGLSISDAANMGIMSFINELHDPHIPDNTETDIFPRFHAIAAVLGLECSVLVDSTPPTTSCSYDGTWHKNDFTIILSANDDLSGTSDTYYRINGGPTRTVNSNGQPSFSTESSNNYLRYWSVDNQGNVETEKIATEIKLDKTPPTIETLSNLTDIWINSTQKIEIHVKASDSLSGIVHITLSYTINDQHNTGYLQMTKNITSGVYSASIPPQTEGTSVRYEITAFDKAGNTITETNTLECGQTIIPEFPTSIILSIFLIMSLLTLNFKKKLISKGKNNN